MSLLEVVQVEKSFGSKKVLKKVSFSVPEQTILGFIGKNGAGKTTLLKMICGLLPIDEGKITLQGELVTYGHNKTNRLIGYLPDVPAFYDYMTAPEYLNLCGELTGMTKSTRQKKGQELLELVGLQGNQDKIKTYSRGMKQRLGIAQALLNEPLLLICDEPTSALDPVGRKEIIEIISKVRHHTTVIFSTHILSDVEKICDQVILLDQGQIRLAMPINQLQRDYGLKQLVIEFPLTTSKKGIEAVLKGYSVKKELAANTFLIEGPLTEEPYQQLYQNILTTKLYPKKLADYQPDLETVFTEVVK